MRRLGALAAAIAMVVAAVAVRSQLDDGGDAGADGVGDVQVLLCAKDLSDVCDAVATELGLQILVEPLSASIDRLTDPAVIPSDTVWATLGPIPELVGDARRRSGLPALLSSPEQVAEAPLSVVAWTNRLERLRGCDGIPTLVCLGRGAGGPWSDLGGDATWGRLKVALPDPDTASGALALGALATAWAGPDTDAATLSAAQLGDPSFRDLLRDVLGSSVGRPGSAADVVDTMLARGPAVADATVVPGPVATAALRDAARGSELSVEDSGSLVRVELVVLSPEASVPAGLLSRFVRFATDEGWTAVTSTPTRLPAGGVIEALMRLAGEVT